ncbi:hypothetical protein N658DRAFT_88149 [Parathielavia hyrcaniae]|uniref:Uncharacterized protein n=1 Tax=Parathielavia hyrcaniae TaxID=113614 RepID=A0AAN6T140_9PEZI|nr:hypothetical protein N658DRAFT_88149 [Parathielavia hyrcaniae]
MNAIRRRLGLTAMSIAGELRSAWRHLIPFRSWARRIHIVCANPPLLWYHSFLCKDNQCLAQAQSPLK